MEIDPRYPIGKYKAKEDPSSAELSDFIDRIEATPSKIEQAIRGLTPSQLDSPYRDGGWTVRQVVHHVADSHMNAYIRVKWTLTENAPVIKAYEEKPWAETVETRSDPSLSISLLKALHVKWVTLLRGLSPEELKRAFVHPQTGKSVRLESMIGMYAWHGDHHLAHILSLKEKMKW